MIRFLSFQVPFLISSSLSTPISYYETDTTLQNQAHISYNELLNIRIFQKYSTDGLALIFCSLSSILFLTAIIFVLFLHLTHLYSLPLPL